MKTIILAAGHGLRMRPLTDNTPKPLLQVGQHKLIEYHLLALAKAGFAEVVINVSYHPQQFSQNLGDGSRYGLKIHYSYEPENEPLGSGGGVFQALPTLGDQPFLVINGDIYTEYPYQTLRQCDFSNVLAHLVLAQNPPHNLKGDFALTEQGFLLNDGEEKFTMSGISIYSPQLFANCKHESFSVVPLLRAAINQQRVTGDLFNGVWIDVGTVERFQQVQQLTK